MIADHSRVDSERPTPLPSFWIPLVTGAILLFGAIRVDSAEDAQKPATTDKTLVAWVLPANLTQQGGSTLTIQCGDQFDAIVLGEIARGKWMAGSDYLRRTERDQDSWGL